MALHEPHLHSPSGRTAIRTLRRIVAVVCGLWTVGCAYAPLRAPADARPSPLPQALAAYYAIPGAPTGVTMERMREHPRYAEFLVRFPLAPVGFEPTEPVVEVEWFESARPGRRPAVLFNPILGGDYPLERGMCRHLAAQGFHVALLHRRTLKVSPEHPVDHLELLLRQGVVRIRRTLAWMRSHPRVDPDRLGTYGVSMGGIASILAAAVEPDVRAHVVVLAGGGIADILATSRDPLLTKPLARFLSARHLDQAALRRQLDETLVTDPIRLAPYVDARRVFMVIALADRTIGRANALRLWRALGRPEATFLPTGHYTALLALPYLKYAGLRFLKERLEAMEGRQVSLR